MPDADSTPNHVFADSPDDLLPISELRRMSGYEFIRGIMEGRRPAPPICAPMNFRFTEVEEGRVTVSGRPQFAHYNPIGSVHGGWFGTLMDSCMACAVQTRLKPGQGYTTLEYRVNIIRAATVETGPLHATGEAIHAGRRTAVAEGRMIDDAGRLYAVGSTTCLVFDLPPD